MRLSVLFFVFIFGAVAGFLHWFLPTWASVLIAWFVFFAFPVISESFIRIRNRPPVQERLSILAIGTVFALILYGAMSISGSAHQLFEILSEKFSRFLALNPFDLPFFVMLFAADIAGV
jgi:hypothetical protein